MISNRAYSETGAQRHALHEGRIDYHMPTVTYAEFEPHQQRRHRQEN